MRLRILVLAGVLVAVSIIAALLLYFQTFPGQQMAACDSYSWTDCPSQCVVCPPCEVCSSMACRSEDFCTSIGFNRTWYEDIKMRLV